MATRKFLGRDYPNVAMEWDQERNAPKDPMKIAASSTEAVWWLCEKGHSWSARVSGRVNNKSGCPVCANRKIVPGVNDLLSHYPELADQWHFQRNAPLLPSQISYGSEKQVWWRCSRSHEWRASPNRRTFQKSGCPYCSNKAVLTGYNDLATTHPKLASDWDPEKNNSLQASQVHAGSHKKVWWLCDQGHSWVAGIVRRSREGTGCPYCSNTRVLEGYNDLASQNPVLVSEWDLKKNSKASPNEVLVSSKRKYWWTCQFGHSFLQDIYSRHIEGAGCNVCAGKQVVAGINDLESKNPELASEWHHNKNGDLSPQNVTMNSNKKVWWLCSQGHEWPAVIANRSRGDSCPTCTGRTLLVGFNDLETLHPELIDEWDHDKNENLDPSSVFGGGTKKRWWKCKSGHSWQAPVIARTSGRGCPSCATFGFDPNSEAELYFLENSDLLAKKVGITNLNTAVSRVDQFGSEGWRTIATFQFEEGWKARAVEADFFGWLRGELRIPVFLGEQETGRLGGWTETFSSEAISSTEVISKLNQLILDK